MLLYALRAWLMPYKKTWGGEVVSKDTSLFTSLNSRTLVNGPPEAKSLPSGLISFFYCFHRLYLEPTDYSESQLFGKNMYNLPLRQKPYSSATSWLLQRAMRINPCETQDYLESYLLRPIARLMACSQLEGTAGWTLVETVAMGNGQ